MGPAAMNGPSQVWPTHRYRPTTNRAADDTSRTGAHGRPFGHLSFLFVSEITGASLIREQHRNIIVREACASKFSDDTVGLCFCINET